MKYLLSLKEACPNSPRVINGASTTAPTSADPEAATSGWWALTFRVPHLKSLSLIGYHGNCHRKLFSMKTLGRYAAMCWIQRATPGIEPKEKARHDLDGGTGTVVYLPKDGATSGVFNRSSIKRDWTPLRLWCTGRATDKVISQTLGYPSSRESAVSVLASPGLLNIVLYEVTTNEVTMTSRLSEI